MVDAWQSGLRQYLSSFFVPAAVSVFVLLYSPTWIHVPLIRDEVAVVGGLLDGHAELLHHTYRHFDIRLGDCLVLLQLQRHVPLRERMSRKVS